MPRPAPAWRWTKSSSSSSDRLGPPRAAPARRRLTGFHSMGRETRLSGRVPVEGVGSSQDGPFFCPIFVPRSCLLCPRAPHRCKPRAPSPAAVPAASRPFQKARSRDAKRVCGPAACRMRGIPSIPVTLAGNLLNIHQVIIERCRTTWTRSARRPPHPQPPEPARSRPTGSAHNGE